MLIVPFFFDTWEKSSDAIAKGAGREFLSATVIIAVIASSQRCLQERLNVGI
jgi:hypothetical protein